MIAIRAAAPGDAAIIAEIYAPHVARGIASFEFDPPDADTMRRRMAASDGYYPWLVATDDTVGQVIGYAYAALFRERAAYRHAVETSIYMAQAAHGQGAGRLLYEALVDTLRAQGFVHAVGVISLPNDASIRLHEAVGFRRAGVYREIGYKKGQWIDVGIWQCELSPPRHPMAEPRPFRETGLVRG